MTTWHDVQATVVIFSVPPARSSRARNGTALRQRGHFRLKISIHHNSGKEGERTSFEIFHYARFYKDFDLLIIVNSRNDFFAHESAPAATQLHVQAAQQIDAAFSPARMRPGTGSPRCPDLKLNFLSALALGTTAWSSHIF